MKGNKKKKIKMKNYLMNYIDKKGKKQKHEMLLLTICKRIKVW